MIASAARLALCCALIAALCLGPLPALAQEEGAAEEEEQQPATPAVEPAAPAPEAPAPTGPTMIQAGGAQMGFEIAPTATNTYTVTADVRGLQCVVGVGSADACAVAGQGPPWDRVKCRPGDASVDTFAWLLGKNKAINLFAAPPALANGSQTRAIDVRLGRVCMRGSAPSKAKRGR